MRTSMSVPLLGSLLLRGVNGACDRDNLLNALLNHTPDSVQFCSEYISIPAIATVPVYTSTCTLSTYTKVSQTVHPIHLFNLQREFGTLTPLLYDTAAPTPITIPGGPQSYGLSGIRRVKRADDGSLGVEAEATPKAELLKRTQPLPTYLATSYPASRISSGCSCLSISAATTTTVSQATLSVAITTTCTTYIPTTTATYPAHCAPSLQVNNPYPAAHASYAVVPDFTVPSKMDCCAACSSVFNCAWWKFTFPPNGHDGWAPGQCRYAYYIGLTSDVGAGDGGIAKVCPNGATRAIDNPDWSHVGQNENNNLGGYNLGACGGGSNIFQSGGDGGAPDGYWLRTCGGSNGEPSFDPPGCAA